MLDEKVFRDTFLDSGSTSQRPKDALQEDDRQAMEEMTVVMRELLEEIRYFRQQIEAGQVTGQGGIVSASHEETEKVSNICGEPSEVKKDAKHKVFSFVGNVLFYTMIVAMVLGAFLIRSSSRGRPFVIAGFSGATVLTSSMEDVYPKGSLIITKSVDADTLRIGDDITFMISEDSSVTHRIIGIYDDPDSGNKLFETKGTMNKLADKNKVIHANIVGKVIFHSKMLGDVANYIRTNWPFLLFVLVVLSALFVFLKWLMREEPPKAECGANAEARRKKRSGKRRKRRRKHLPKKTT